MTPLVRSAQAILDLASIANYLGRDNPDSGLRFLDAAEAAFEFLQQFPDAPATLETDLPKLSEIRAWPIKDFD